MIIDIRRLLEDATNDESSFSLFKNSVLLDKLSKRVFPDLPCACCDNGFYDSGEIYACQHCRAPMCSRCAHAPQYHTKRCIWCTKLVSRPEQINLRDTNLHRQYRIDLERAMMNFRYLNDFFRKIIQADSKFDFSKIVWLKYFEKLGWRFYIDAPRFLIVELPKQCDVVMANMVFHHSFLLHLTHFKYLDNRNKFVPCFQRFRSDQEPFLFFQSRQIALMQTMSIMILERMGNPFFDGVLRRVNAKFVEKLSIGLGVRIRSTMPII